MYAFQFQDATYRIDLFVSNRSSTDLFGRILFNVEALALFQGVYETKAAAEQAITRIRQLIA